LARKVKNDARINEEVFADNTLEKALSEEREKSRKLTTDNMRLIEKNRNYKALYEKLFEKFISIQEQWQNQINKPNINKNVFKLNLDEQTINNLNNEERNLNNFITSLNNFNVEFNPNSIFANLNNDIEGFNNLNIHNNNLFNLNNNQSNFNYNSNNTKSAMNKPNHTKNQLSASSANLNLNFQKAISDDDTREDFKNTYENCFRELERFQEDITKKEKALQSKEFKINDLKFEILEINTEKNSLKDEIKVLKRKNEKLYNENKNASADLTSIMMQNSEYEKKIQTLNDIIEDNSKEYKRNLSDNEIYADKLINKIKKLEDDLDLKRKDIQIEREKYRDLKISLENLEEKLKLVMNEKKDLFNKIENLENSINDLNRNMYKKDTLLEENQIEILNLKNEINILKIKGKDIMKIYLEELEKKDKEIKGKQIELDQKRLVLDDAISKIKRFKKEYEDAIDNIKEKKILIEKLSNELEYNKIHVENCQTTEKELLNKINELDNEITQLTRSEYSIFF